MNKATSGNDSGNVLGLWAQHQAQFQAQAFIGNDLTSIISLDRSAQPPTYILLEFKESFKKASASTGYILDTKMAAQSLDKILELIEMRAIPCKDMEACVALEKLGFMEDKLALATASFERFHEKVTAISGVRTAARLPKEKFIAAEAARFDRSGFTAVKNSLDSQALKVLSACDKFKWRDYLYYSGNDERAEIRRQAAQEYPLLASKMLEFISIKSIIDEKQPLGVALQKMMGVDANGNNILSKAVIDRLRKLDWPTGGIPIDKLLTSISAFNKVTDPKRDVPTDWFPKTKEDWDAFCDISETVGTKLKEDTGQGLGSLYSGSGGKWTDLKERLAKAYTDDRPPEGVIDEDKEYFKNNIDWKELAKLPRDKVEAAAQKIADELKDLPERINRQDVAIWIKRCFAPDTSRSSLAGACIQAEEMINGFASKVLLPLAANVSGLDKVYLRYQNFALARELAAKILFEGKAATNILDVSKKFHNGIVAIMAAGSDETDDDKDKKLQAARMSAAASALGVDPENQDEKSWPFMTPIVQSPNGIWIVPLTNSKLLEMEGYRGINPDGTEGLHHCVGTNGYDAKCRRGSHIISMRELINNDTAYTRLSTAEINPLIQGDFVLKVAQHQGKGNGGVPAKSKWAFQWYSEQIANGNIKLNYEGIKEYLGTIGNKIDEVQANCDYNWKEITRVNRALKVWCEDKPGYLAKKYRKMSAEEFANEPEIQELSDSINPRLKPYKI